MRVEKSLFYSEIAYIDIQSHKEQSGDNQLDEFVSNCFSYFCSVPSVGRFIAEKPAYQKKQRKLELVV